MRGHWLSGTRKLNRHYQSGSGGSSYRSWDYDHVDSMVSTGGFENDYGAAMTITAGNPIEFPNALFNLMFGRLRIKFTVTDPADSGTDITVPTRSPGSRGFKIAFRYYVQSPTGWNQRYVYGGLNYAGDPYYIPVDGGTFPIYEYNLVGGSFVWVDTGYTCVVQKITDGEYEIYSNDDPTKYWWIHWGQWFRYRTNNSWSINEVTEWVKL